MGGFAMRGLGKIGLGILMFLAIATGTASATCSNSNVNGAYGFAVRGVSDPSGNPLATVGLFTADGTGNVGFGKVTQSNTGAVTTATFTGTYNISADCIGTLTTTDSNSITRHYFVVLSGMKADVVDLTETDAGLTMSGAAHPQGVGICGLTGKRTPFAEHVTGVAGAVPEAIAGRVGTDGNGNITFGFAVSNLGGANHKLSKVSGTYTANSDCTGSVQTTFGGATYNFNYVSVDGGRQYLMIETDANTTVAGTLALQ
jgi:hypothetical protein